MTSRGDRRSGVLTARRRLTVVCLFTALALGRPSAQDSAPPAPGLDLAGVVQATLSSNPDIQTAVQQTENSRGSRVAAGAPFDLLLNAAASASRQHTEDPLVGTAASITNSFGMQRLLRNGMQLNTDVGLARSSHTAIPGPQTPNDLSASLALTAPLLRDRGGIVSAAPERAAARTYESNIWLQRDTIAQRLLTAVGAYWDYLVAIRRLEVYVEAEKRAERTVEQTRALVKADERTNADLTQMLGNLAAKRVTRIAAEQAVVAAWVPLALAMGLPPESILNRPSPSTDFPALPADTGTPRIAAQLLEAAFSHRPDLAAAEESVKSAQVLTSASTSELKPRLDLVFSTGYMSRAFGRGFGTYFDGFDSGGANNLNASFALKYEFLATNAAARGKMLQNAAALEEARITRDAVRRRIAAGVTVAIESLARGESGMKVSEEAVDLLGQTVQAEQRKFTFGMATLFDVINAQDALTNALLGRIDAQRNFAVAIASLRYESGTLIESSGSAPDTSMPVVPMHVLLTPP